MDEVGMVESAVVAVRGISNPSGRLVVELAPAFRTDFSVFVNDSDGASYGDGATDPLF